MTIGALSSSGQQSPCRCSSGVAAPSSTPLRGLSGSASFSMCLALPSDSSIATGAHEAPHRTVESRAQTVRCTSLLFWPTAGLEPLNKLGSRHDVVDVRDLELPNHADK